MRGGLKDLGGEMWASERCEGEEWISKRWAGGNGYL